MAAAIIQFEKNTLGYGNVILKVEPGVVIKKGVTAVVGNNGAGKSTFGTILEKGRHAYGNRLLFTPENLKVKMLAFSDIHSLSGMEVHYHAQRMEATMNDYVPTVAEAVGKKIESDQWQNLASNLGLRNAADKKINFLSSGELRKLLIINALINHPDVLVLDNPYIGLDSHSREEFNDMLFRLHCEGTSFILLVSSFSDAPEFAESVIHIEEQSVKPGLPYSDYKKLKQSHETETTEIVLPPRPGSPLSCDIAFAIENGHLKYGDKTVFEHLDWKVNMGECWALTGRNGSGKSLLLSMVCADHPQAYSNKITLFSKLRGSGESIWDIKDNIGYVSPEMQLFFKSVSTVLEIVGQGLRKSIKKFGALTQEESETAMHWLKLFGIEKLAERKFHQLSSGEQRMVLLARAMIRQPNLLVLDEPFHGLDDRNKKRVTQIIEAMTERNGNSLIFVTHYPEELPSVVKHIFTIGASPRR